MMGKRILLSFATDGFEPARQRLIQSSLPYFDRWKTKAPKDLPENHQYTRLYRDGIGYGYWSWKPYFIVQTINGMAEDDLLFYADSQCVFESDPFDMMGFKWRERGIGLFNMRQEQHKNSEWTKGDCFYLMGCEDPKYIYGDNLPATYSSWTVEGLPFATQWMQWSLNYEVVSENPSTLRPDEPDFIQHSYEQSVLSLLAIKYGIETMPDPVLSGTIRIDRSLEPPKTFKRLGKKR